MGHYRKLADSNPAAFLPDLALSLNNLSNRQSEMGERASALESIAEAVGHYRKLAGSNPAAFLPGLALSLNNLSIRWSQLQRWGITASWQDRIRLRSCLIWRCR